MRVAIKRGELSENGLLLRVEVGQLLAETAASTALGTPATLPSTGSIPRAKRATTGRFTCSPKTTAADVTVLSGRVREVLQNS